MLKQTSEKNTLSVFPVLLLQKNSFCRHCGVTNLCVKTGGESLTRRCLKGATSCLGAENYPHARYASTPSHKEVKQQRHKE